MSLSVTYRGKEGSKPRFAAIDGQELIQSLQERFGSQWDIQGNVEPRHVKAAQMFGGGSRTNIKMLAKIPTVLPSGETVRAMLLLSDQDFAGKCLTINYGLYRLVCSNGLMSFRSVASPTAIPHFKNRTDQFIYLVDQIEASTVKYRGILEHVIALQNRVISNPIALVESMKLPTKAKKQVIELIQTGRNRPEDNVNTAWGLYNLVNEVDRLAARRNSTAYETRDLSNPIAA